MRIFTKPPAIIKFFADFSNFCLADFFLEAFDNFAFAAFSAFCPPAGFHGKNLAPKYTEIFYMGSSWRLQLPPPPLPVIQRGGSGGVVR